MEWNTLHTSAEKMPQTQKARIGWFPMPTPKRTSKKRQDQRYGSKWIQPRCFKRNLKYIYTHMLNIWSIHLPLVVVLGVNLGNYTIKLSIWDINLIQISPTDCFNLERIWAFLKDPRKPESQQQLSSRLPGMVGTRGCQWMFGDVEIYHAIEGRWTGQGHKRRVRVGWVGWVGSWCLLRFSLNFVHNKWRQDLLGIFGMFESFAGFFLQPLSENSRKNGMDGFGTTAFSGSSR